LLSLNKTGAIKLFYFFIFDEAKKYECYIKPSIMNMLNTTFKELQEEVIENNRQLDLIFNSLPQSMALVTPNYEILRVNQNFLSLYGVKNEDVIGQKCHYACFQRESVCDSCLVEKALISKKTEKRIKSFPTGEICEMTAKPVLNQMGEVTHILDIRTSITELVEKDREIRRIQFAMDQSSDEFWLFDNNWKVIYVSNSASKNLGFTISELKNSPVEKFNLLPRLENLSSLFERLRKKKNIRIESVQYKKDGSTYPCEMNLNYFSDQGEYIYAVVRNISKRKKYENGLIESREKSERVSKLKSVFLANMSHEIRTPMNAIIGFSNFILEEEIDAVTKIELKKEINENCQYLLSIIGDIMEISQLESGNRIVEKNEFNVSDLLKTIYDEQSKNCPEPLTFYLIDELQESSAILNSDRKIIKQVIERLIGNAFKFTSAGIVEFGCTFNAKKETFEFFVKDTGIGISYENQVEIFEPFHQLNPMIKGTGIGLTICKTYLSMLHSQIRVDSVFGKGSAFSFRVKVN
jgi:PAS domain S-box-containing protein